MALFRFYINSSIHVALAVVSLAWVTALYFEIHLDKIFTLMLFLAAVSGYNFVKYADVARWHHRSLTPGLRYIQIFSFVCGLGFLISLWYMPLSVFLWGGVFGVMTLLYALPVFSRKRTLRGISGIKIYIIALVWAGATVVLPLAYAKVEVNTESVLFFLQRFLFIWVLTLPFEIRDLQYDDRSLQTVAQLLGIKRLKAVGTLVLLMMLVVGWISQPWGVYSISSLIISGITAIGLWKASTPQSPFYAAFWIEAISILWLLVFIGMLGWFA